MLRAWIILLFVFPMKLLAQAPPWVWAKGAGGSDDEIVFSIASDNSGNIYEGGYFRSQSIIFGLDTLYNINYPNGIKMFIVKYDPNGSILWARTSVGQASDNITGVSIDPFGSVYVTGNFGNAFLVFGQDTLTSFGGSDVFVAKYDPLGNAIWGKSFGGGGYETAFSITCNPLGDLFVTGRFEFTYLIVETDTFYNIGNNYQLFLVKYDTSGTYLWARSVGADKDEEGHFVKADQWGNVYVTGIFRGDSVVFGTTTLLNTSPPFEDIFLTKYDSVGNVSWARKAKGNAGDTPYSIELDVKGNIYLAGSFSGQYIIFGTTNLSNAGSEDIFLAKYDTSGNALWAKRAGGANYDFGASISADGFGNIYLIGSFSSSSIVFGTSSLVNSSANYFDIFVAKYDSLGNALWGKRAGGTNNDRALATAIDTFGNIYVGGDYSSQTEIFGPDTLQNSGLKDVFLAKISTISNISELSGKFNITVFPNPSSGIFHIECLEPILEVTIYDVLGTKIYDQMRQKEIDISGFANGVYILCAQTKKGKFVSKILKCGP